MGAVLAMSKWRLGPALGLTALLALAACGAGPANEGRATSSEAPLGSSAGEARVLRAVSQARGLLSGIGSDNGVSGSRTVPGGFSPQAVAAEPTAYRLVQINALGLQEVARVIQVNGDEITLALQSGPTAAFDAGVLTATRGFGNDLLTMGAPGLLAALRADGGQVTRTMETLNAQDQIVTEQLSCTVSAAGRETINLGVREVTARRLNENCRGASVIFDNIYWLDEAGSIISSRQYVSPSVAYLRNNRL